MNRTYSITGLLIILALLRAWGCDRQAPNAPGAAPPPQPKPQSLPTVKITIVKQQFDLEVAKDDDQRAIGLMHRDSMPQGHGMLFVFPDEQPRSFWMRNTHIPLDILYLDRAGQVVSIRELKPLDLTDVPSGRPAQFAIELNRGAAAAAGVKVGDVVAIPSELVRSAR